VKPETYETHEAEISILDLLLVVAQNLRILILGPLLAGVVALGVSFLFIPVKFESVAVQAADPQLAAMYSSAQVLDSVIQTMGYAKTGEDTDTARERLLAKDYSVKYNSKDKTLRLETLASTPKDAQRMAQTAIELTTKLNQLRVDNNQRLKEQFDLALARERTYSQAAQRISAQIQSSAANNQAALTEAQAKLLDSAREAQIVAAQLSEKIRVADSFDLIQTPTLPKRKHPSGRALISVVASLATGFALLVWVFIVHFVRNSTGQDAERIHKLTTALRSSVLRQSS
jgi:hypothetical protein